MELEEVRKYWKDFPEAPVSNTFRWIDEQGFEHQSTIRAWSFSSLIDIIARAQAEIVGVGGKPAGAPKLPVGQKVQERDENGTPVVDPDGKPVMIDLPKDVHIFTVAKAYHGKTQTGKDFLGVVTAEQPYNRKWGVKCFHPPFKEWKTWAVGESEPNYFAVTDEYGKVVIREAEGEGKYPDVLEFKPK